MKDLASALNVEIANAANNADVLHNHPNDATLSDADLYLLRNPGMRSIVAIGHLGSDYAARASATEHTAALLPHLPTIWNAARDRLYDDLLSLIDSEALSADVANQWFFEIISRSMSHVGLLD